MNQKIYDPAVPPKLRLLQQWFGSIITQPLREDNTIQPRAPQRNLIRPETARFVRPSQHLAPYQRMQIYNQQYWWRLLKNLRENFATAFVLLGKQRFERLLAYPYFSNHPPEHWALIRLGPHLSHWCQEKYRGPHQQFIQDSTLVEYFLNIGFVAGHLDPIRASEADLNELSSQPLYLQPHFKLLSFPYDLMRFRAVLLEAEEDHWLTHPLPEVDHSRSFYYITFRNNEGLMIWRYISEAMAFLLGLFEKGCSIDQACEKLESQPEAIQQEVAANLQSWMEEWVGNEWLTLTPCNHRRS